MRRAAALAVGLCLMVLGGPAEAQRPAPRFINPPDLTRPTGYTHVVVSADGRTAYIAGQVSLDSTGRIVGAGDFRVQAERVFGNLRTALASVGATFGDVLKLTTYITDAKNIQSLREIRSRYFDPEHQPANTLLVVALSRPELLLEIEAVVDLSR